MNHLKVLALSAGALTLVPGLALAHGSMRPSHGGVVQMSGEIMVELVTKPKALEIYVTEEDEPIPAADFDGTLIVTAPGGAKTRSALKAVSGNKFVSSGRPGSGSKVVVSLIEKKSSAKTFASFTMK
ncbi:MAG: hypothetical protein KDE32_01445 [Novosphingobium sp.]|nr:hypothetical protein [Novosphingobium sp.]